MGIELYGVGPMLAKKVDAKAEVAAERTEITKAEKVGYSVSPIIQGTIDLIQGDSFQEVGDKLVLTTKDNIDGAKELTKKVYENFKEYAEDAKQGPLPRWLALLGVNVPVVNVFAD